MDTGSVIPAGFHGAGARLTMGDIDRAAAALGVENRLIEAVAYVEANNHGFLDDGRPQLLFEAHQFHRLTGGQWDQSHPNISSAAWDARLYGAAGAHQYDRLGEAMALDRSAALEAATWGMFQELGGNFQAVGFRTIDDFVAAMCAGEGRHLDVFVAHCTHFDLIQYLRSEDWLGFARGYNGAGQVNYYAAKLEAAYKAGRFPPVLPAPDPAPGPQPVPLPIPALETIEVVLRPGLERVFPGVVALDQDGVPIDLTSGALISGDSAIAGASVSGPDDQQKYTIRIAGVGLGQTRISGPGIAWAVTVEASTLAQVVVDAGKAFTRRIPAAAAVMAVMLMVASAPREPAVDRADAPFILPQMELARLPAASSPLNSLEKRCLADLGRPAYEIERCLEWVHVSRR